MDPYLTASFFESSAVNIVMYVLLLLVLIIVVWVEVTVQMCPNGAFSTCANMGIDNGLLTHGTKAKDSDSCTVILEKTTKVAAANVNSVRWRISFILATIIAALLWLLIFQIIPHWIILYLTILIAFLVIYFYFNFSGFHVNNEIFKIVEGNLNILKSKCKC